MPPPGSGPPPRASLPPSLRFSATRDQKPRHVVSTRSLALAARPPGYAQTALLNHRQTPVSLICESGDGRGTGEDGVDHVLGEPAGERVVGRRVVAAKHGQVAEGDLGAVTEPGARARHLQPDVAECGPGGGPA